jgi:t-SNARE complex subunit (syntaxin)
MVTESEPLVAIDDVPAETNTTQDTSATENEQLLTIDISAAYKQKLLMKKILILIIIVNLVVLISIILCT